MVKCCCGELVEAWTRFHYAKPHTDPEQPGHYVDGGSRDLQAELQEGFEGEGLAPPPPERLPTKLQGIAPSEDDVREAVVNYLDLLKWEVWDLEQGYRSAPGGSRVTPGVADVLAIGHGAIVFIELKSPKGQTARKKQRPRQKIFERAVLENGGIYLLVESLDQVKIWEKAHRSRRAEMEQIELKT